MSCKDLDNRSFQDNLAFTRPPYDQIAARKRHCHVIPFDSPFEPGNDSNGACAGTASHRFPRSSLPDAHFDVTFVDDVDDLAIDALGKKWMMRDSRPQPCKRDIVHRLV